MKLENFNEESYFNANPDVKVAVADGMFRSGKEHYELFGKKEGRLASLVPGESIREARVFHLCNRKGRGLEIGPSHNPIASKRKGYNVEILDHLSADDLRKKYAGHNLNLDNIEEVDFVWNGEPLTKLIGDSACYDWIIASHVIEHVPDFVSFLRECGALLKPDGVLSLVIPDRRYCFDYFSPSSTTGNVLDAYFEKRIQPSPGQIFDHFTNAATREGKIAWSNDDGVGADGLIHTFEAAREQFELSIAGSEYIDAHCWRFTPASFQILMSDLQRLDLVNLELLTMFNTIGCEFYASMGRKHGDSALLDRLTALNAKKQAEL